MAFDTMGSVDNLFSGLPLQDGTSPESAWSGQTLINPAGGGLDLNGNFQGLAGYV